MVIKAHSPAGFAEQYIVESIWNGEFPPGSIPGTGSCVIDICERNVKTNRKIDAHIAILPPIIQSTE